MVGKIIPLRQNALQKFIHKITSNRPVTEFFAPRMHIIDGYMLNITRGRYTLAQIAGWTIVQITTIGAKSGHERTTPLLVGVDGDTLALIASSFGREKNPGWYYNLKKNPECKVTYKGHTSTYIAREAVGEEYGYYWNVVSSQYPGGYASYKNHAAHRRIPVMVLEKKNNV